jgi:uncharacterized membrane protein
VHEPKQQHRPAVAEAGDPQLSPVLARNIETLCRRRHREAAAANLEDAHTITRFTGSMPFVYLHLAIFGFWVVANLGEIEHMKQDVRPEAVLDQIESERR